MVDTQRRKTDEGAGGAQGNGPLRRMYKNAGWLLAGEGMGGVLSLIYTGLVARSLGAEQFGIFALILAYVQSVAALAKFESWQIVVRYGAMHLERNAPDRLRRILNFSTALDLGSAVLGAAFAMLGVYVVGPHLGWTSEDQTIAVFACTLLVFNIRGTPIGILRLFNRFDVAALAEAGLLAVRLLGALIAWAIGASVSAYLFVWVMAELITAVAIWWSALRTLGRETPGLYRNAGFELAGVRSENPGLWSFSWTTNLDFSLKQVWKYLPVLAVGWAVDAVSAGGFRIASNLGNAVGKPSAVLALAIFPELARLKETEPSQINMIVRKASIASALVGVVALVLTVLFGRQALWALGGDGYAFAYGVTIIMAVAAVIELYGLTLESAIVALGYPEAVLFARSVVALTYVALLVTLVPVFGFFGAAYTSVIAAVVLLALILIKFRAIAREVA